MSAQTTVDVSAALMTANALQHLMKAGSKQGVLTMSREIAGASASATRIARAVRTIVKKKPGEPAEPGLFYAKRPQANGKTLYIGIVAPAKAWARRDKRAQVRMRGLAKSSWFWILSGLGANRAGAKKYSGVRRNRKYYEVRDQHRARNPAILLWSKLQYAQDAFKTKGRATVDNIGTRAANRFIRKMERKAEKVGRSADIAAAKAAVRDL